MIVPVEVSRENGERLWRLSKAVDEYGLDFEKPLSWEVGRPVEVTFPLPDGERITAQGRVEGECAVKFTFLDDATKLSINRYVAERIASL